MLSEHNQSTSRLCNVGNLPSRRNEHLNCPLIPTVEDNWPTCGVREVSVIDIVSHVKLVVRGTPMIDEGREGVVGIPWNI
jgi:hypothetical protein